MNLVPVYGIFDFEEDIANFLHDAIKGLMEWGIDAYNMFTNRAIHFLKMTPFDTLGGAGSGPYKALKNISDAFIDYGTSLVAFFFLLGLYQELKESKFEVKLESILFDILKLMLAVYLVQNNFSILEKFSNVVQDMSKLVVPPGNDDVIKMELAKTFKTNLEDVGAGKSLVLLIFGMVYVGVVVCSGVALLLSALKRSFKMIGIIPFGSIASSTFAGNHQVSQTGVSFYKWSIGTLLEAITMIVAITVFTSLFNTEDWYLLMPGSSFGKDGLSGFSFCAFWMLEKALLILTLCTTVSGASELTHRALGL